MVGMSYWSVKDNMVKCPCGWEGPLMACDPYTSEEGTMLLGCDACGLVLFEASPSEVEDEEHGSVFSAEEFERQLLLARSKLYSVEHARKVTFYLSEVAEALTERGEVHDISKTEEPELSMFSIWGPRLAQLEYGTKEYGEALEKMGEALQHHYRNNRHHPEAHERGVDGMTLVDLVEMVCDWRAACQRTKNGDFFVSLAHNAKRFNISPQLVNIIANTAREWKADE